MKRFVICLCCSVLFLFAACTSAKPIDSVSIVQEIAPSVLDPMKEQWLISNDKEAVADLLQIDSSLLESGCFYCSKEPTNVTAFGGITIQDENKQDVIQALKAYQEKAKEDFEGYLPDQYQIAENAQILDYGNTLFLVMTDCNEEIINQIEKEIEQ